MCPVVLATLVAHHTPALFNVIALVAHHTPALFNVIALVAHHTPALFNVIALVAHYTPTLFNVIALRGLIWDLLQFVFFWGGGLNVSPELKPSFDAKAHERVFFFTLVHRVKVPVPKFSLDLRFVS